MTRNIPSNCSSLCVKDDYEACTIRYEDEMISQRSSRSRRSSIAQAEARDWALSLQALDFEYNRHDAETWSVASVPSISRWADFDDISPKSWLNEDLRVLIDVDVLFTNVQKAKAHEP